MSNAQRSRIRQRAAGCHLIQQRDAGGMQPLLRCRCDVSSRGHDGSTRLACRRRARQAGAAGADAGRQRHGAGCGRPQAPAMRPDDVSGGARMPRRGLRATPGAVARVGFHRGASRRCNPRTAERSCQSRAMGRGGQTRVGWGSLTLYWRKTLGGVHQAERVSTEAICCLRITAGAGNRSN